MKSKPLPRSKQADRALWRFFSPWLLALLFSGTGPAMQAQAQAAPAAALASPADATANAAAKGTLLAVIKATGKYGVFLKAIEAAGLTATLEQAGPYTIFAPTDDAFAKLPAGTLDRLLKPESKAKLVAVINYHIVASKVTTAALSKLEELKTLNGEEIDVDTAADGKTIEMDDAKIVGPALEASNGLVHPIDSVLQP